LCSQQRIWSAHAKKRGLNRKADPPVHDDLVERRFVAERSDQTWLADITEPHPRRQAVFVRDPPRLLRADRRLLDGLADESALAVSALRNAIALRSPIGTIVHSDRGSQGEFNWSSQHLDRGGDACTDGTGALMPRLRVLD
jgi:transposase InsO family protein